MHYFTKWLEITLFREFVISDVNIDKYELVFVSTHFVFTGPLCVPFIFLFFRINNAFKIIIIVIIITCQVC